MGARVTAGATPAAPVHLSTLIPQNAERETATLHSNYAAGCKGGGKGVV